jgi:hypothetical protein
VQAIKIDRVVVARRMQDHAVRRRACLFVADIGVAHGGTNGNAISRLCTMPQNSPPRLNYGSYRVATYACYSMPRTTRVKCTLSIESAGNSSFIARARPGPLALVMRVFQDLYVRLVSPCLRDDCDGSALRLLAWQSRDPDPTRRLLALAEIYDGVPRSEAARAGGAGVQIVRDWVLRFNAEAAGY